MKKYIYTLLVWLPLAFFYTGASAQSEIDTTVSLDILTVPNSPAFNLLEISPGAVDKPTTPNDFAISFANASNNFSVIPKNYAIEFLPLSFFPKSKASYARFTNDPRYVIRPGQKLWNTVSQTFLVSAGFATDDSVKTTTPNFIKTRAGIGLKFSLVRGRIDTAFTNYKKSIDTVRQKLLALQTIIDARWELYKQTDLNYLRLASQRDTLVKELLRISKDNSLTANEKAEKSEHIIMQMKTVDSLKTLVDEQYKAKLMKEEKSALYNAAQALKMQIGQVKFRRYGWMLDFAGGMVLGFRNDDFQNSVVQQYAFWFNGGYACPEGFSFMGVARYSNVLNVVSESQGSGVNKAFYDFGGKIEYQTSDHKFALNGELVDRVSSGAPQLRYTFNASYQVGRNQALTFSVGKAFAGTAQYGGSLIAALNYIKTFGSKRSIVPSP